MFAGPTLSGSRPWLTLYKVSFVATGPVSRSGGAHLPLTSSPLITSTLIVQFPPYLAGILFLFTWRFVNAYKCFRYVMCSKTLSLAPYEMILHRRNVATNLLLRRSENNILVYKSVSWERKTERKSQMTDHKLTRTWQMKEVEEESSPRWSSSSLILWLLHLRVLFKHWFQFHSQYPVGLSGDWEDTSRQHPSASFKNHRLSLYKHLFEKKYFIITNVNSILDKEQYCSA